jgi:hypothetical protein
MSRIASAFGACPEHNLCVVSIVTRDGVILCRMRKDVAANLARKLFHDVLLPFIVPTRTIIIIVIIIIRILQNAHITLSSVRLVALFAQVSEMAVDDCGLIKIRRINVITLASPIGSRPVATGGFGILNGRRTKCPGCKLASGPIRVVIVSLQEGAISQHHGPCQALLLLG